MDSQSVHRWYLYLLFRALCSVVARGSAGGLLCSHVRRFTPPSLTPTRNGVATKACARSYKWRVSGDKADQLGQEAADWIHDDVAIAPSEITLVDLDRVACDGRARADASRLGCASLPGRHEGDQGVEAGHRGEITKNLIALDS